VADRLRRHGVEVETVRAVDHDFKPGVESDMGDGDAWPGIRSKILGTEILIMASPTWVGQPSMIPVETIRCGQTSRPWSGGSRKRSCRAWRSRSGLGRQRRRHTGNPEDP
jgi:hypothetical protein